MRRNLLEARVLSIITAIENGSGVEDAHVELKTLLPDPRVAANQIAAHCNASHADPVLWIIGIDEKRGAIGVDRTEISNWISQCESYFDDKVAPDLISHVWIPYGPRNVLALLFASDRAPYVIVRTDRDGERVIPWRSGTKTRTAKRHELLQILAAQSRQPDIEVLKGSLKWYEADGAQLQSRWVLRVHLYLVPQDGNPLVFPFHRCRVEFLPPVTKKPHPLRELSLNHLTQHVRGGTKKLSATVEGTVSELILTGPGEAVLYATSPRPELRPPPPGEIEARANLSFVGGLRPLRIPLTFYWNTDSQWDLA